MSWEDKNRWTQDVRKLGLGDVRATQDQLTEAQNLASKLRNELECCKHNAEQQLRIERRATEAEKAELIDVNQQLAYAGAKITSLKKEQMGLRVKHAAELADARQQHADAVENWDLERGGLVSHTSLIPFEPLSDEVAREIVEFARQTCGLDRYIYNTSTALKYLRAVASQLGRRPFTVTRERLEELCDAYIVGANKVYPEMKFIPMKNLPGKTRDIALAAMRAVVVALGGQQVDTPAR
jgi:hypothetical protein